MNTNIRRILILIVLLFSIWALGGHTYNQLTPFEKGAILTQVKEGDFVVTLESAKEHYTKGESLEVWTSLTYTGVKPFQRIYHSSSIYFLSIEEIDNSYYKGFGVLDVLKTRTLYRNVTYRENLIDLGHLNLEPGSYIIKAIASFSTQDSLDIHVFIPVELQIEIQ